MGHSTKTMSEADFTTASEEIKTWKPANGSPGNDEKLCLYANFKQATVGDCTTARPGMFDLSGKAKWDAWDAMKGKTNDDARKDYITECNRQKETFGTA